MDETRQEETGEVKNKGGRPRKGTRAKRAKKVSPLSRRKLAVARRAAKKAFEDPAHYARQLQIMAKARRARKGSPRLGIPDGWTRERAEMQRMYDGIRADLLIDRMKAEGMVEQTKAGDFEIIEVEHGGKKIEVRIPKSESAIAEAALREAVIGALSPLTWTKDKLGYIRTALEYTKAKPAQTINQNHSAEDWLADALKDNAQTYDADRDGEGEAT